MIARVVLRIGYNLYFSPLRQFPGPKLWAATAVPYTRAQLSGDLIPKLMKFHQKYGSIVRIKPDELSWIDEGVWKDVSAPEP